MTAIDLFAYWITIGDRLHTQRKLSGASGRAREKEAVRWKRDERTHKKGLGSRDETKLRSSRGSSTKRQVGQACKIDRR